MRARTFLLALGAGCASTHGCGAGMKRAGDAPAAMAPEMMGGMAAPGEAMADDAGHPPGAAVAMVARPPAAGGDAAALNDAKEGAWAAVREFAPPTYDPADDGPRDDFRETIYWAPALRTGADGRATVTFPVSDAITSFRAIAEGLGGGAPGHGEAVIASRLPVSVAANLPVEVTTGDRIDLPVTITNNTSAGFEAVVTAAAGDAVALDATRRTVWVPARSSRTATFAARVTGVDGGGGAGDVILRVRGGDHVDELRRTLRIAPNGFPARRDVAGTLAGAATHRITVPESAVPGSVHAVVRLYPSPVATMVAAVDALIAEPSGCFEQASSSNYPNVMVMAYLDQHGGASPEVEARVDAALDRGYQLLTGYESPTKGFEWFGGDPGHEALTAYGLMQFRDMAKVYPSLDATMVDRTVAWLKARRDGKGGYLRNARALDSFGAASPEVTDAYITYALTEAGERGLSAELARAKEIAATTKDPYLLALSAGALVNVDPASKPGRAALDRLVTLQAEDGRFPGADHSITRSGGIALEIETTALAALALMDAGVHADAVARAVDWLTGQRGAMGGFSSTQATILALDALTAHAGAAKVAAGSEVSLWVNGARVGVAAVEEVDGAIVLPDVGAHLRAGANTLELRGPDGAEIPYSVGVAWHDAAPASSPDATVHVATTLAKARVRVGRGVRLTATIENTTREGRPMTMARIGIPGGLRYQPWQLDELVDRGVVDFVETREREVILYLRSMKPGETRTVPIELLAQVPGRYVAPPSSAYLYYTDEHRHYAAPAAVTITRPVAKKKARKTTAPGAATTPTSKVTP